MVLHPSVRPPAPLHFCSIEVMEFAVTTHCLSVSALSTATAHSFSASFTHRSVSTKKLVVVGVDVADVVGVVETVVEAVVVRVVVALLVAVLVRLVDGVVVVAVVVCVEVADVVRVVVAVLVAVVM